MNKRVIINVGVGGWYPRGQNRLRESLESFNDGTFDLMFWREWPGRPHSDMPFAFKADAFRLAREAGYRQILWLDCSCWAVKPLSPLWEKIERDGFVFVNNGWHLGQWASDYCLEVFGKTRDEAMGMLDLTAMLMGLNMDDPKAVAWLAEFESVCREPRLMNGSLKQNVGQVTIDPHSGYDCGVISSDPRCIGHSREQVCAGFLAHKHGLLPYSESPLYLIQGLHPSKPAPESTIIQSCGM